MSKDKKSPKELGELAQYYILEILTMGYTCRDIEEEMGDRVSYRTLYRWKSGEANPKRQSDVNDLAKVYARLKNKNKELEKKNKERRKRIKGEK